MNSNPSAEAPKAATLQASQCSAEELLEFSKKQIQFGSKSFCFASLFFSKKERAGSWLLYSWCRYVDDEIDKAADKADALQRLAWLEQGTREAFYSKTPLSNPHFEGLRLIIAEFNIPLKYPLDMLRGMKMDVEDRVYETADDLEDYCYCVAGVVGLMMCHIMGTSSSQALSHAVALGSAMQLTNISRDVHDDLALGRIYFPRQWMKTYGMTEAEFALPQNRRRWALLSQKLLDLAHQRYNEGRQGLQYLSFRAALACGIAASVYEEIGTKVLKRKDKAWDERCYVPLSTKIRIALFETLRLSARLSRRLIVRWTRKPIETVWGER